MPISPSPTQVSLSVRNATELATVSVTQSSPGDIAYKQDDKTHWTLDTTAMAGGIPTSNKLGRWLPLVTSTITGTSTTLVYQPGGVAEGNVYTNPWLLYQAIVAAGGIVDVYVDCSIVSPAPWPVDQPIPGVRLHEAPTTPVPALLGVVDGTNPSTGFPSLGTLLDLSELDAVGVINVSSTANAIAQVGGASTGSMLTLRRGAFIQRANDLDLLALDITPSPGVPFRLTIEDCVAPFPNLADPGAWNVNFLGGGGDVLDVLVLVAGPAFRLPSFASGPGTTLNLSYDDTVPASQLAEGAWQGTVNLIPLAQGGTVAGVWFVDISQGVGPGTTPAGDGSFSNPFNLIQSAIDAAVAAYQVSQAYGQVIQITEGFSSENLVMPATETILGLTFRGASTFGTTVSANAGVTFFWQPNVALAPGQSPPEDLSFENILFNTQDAVSNTVVIDGSLQVGEQPLHNIRFYNCQIDLGGGSPSAGIPLVLKSVSATFLGDDGNSNISANGGSNVSAQVWNGQFTLFGNNVSLSLLQVCADYRVGAPPISGQISIVQVSGNAQIGEIQPRGTPFTIIGVGGTIGTINSYALDPSPATGFATNTPGAWVGGTVPPGVLGPGPANIAPVFGIAGILGSILGPGAPSLVTYGDFSAFPAPMIGPALFAIGGATIAGQVDVENTGVANLYVDWTGAKLFSNVFNGTTTTFTAGNNVTIDLRGAEYDATWLVPAGTGRFIRNEPSTPTFALGTNNATVAAAAGWTPLLELSGALAPTIDSNGGLELNFTVSGTLDMGGLGQSVSFRLTSFVGGVWTPLGAGSKSRAMAPGGNGCFDSGITFYIPGPLPGPTQPVRVEWRVSAGNASINDGGDGFEGGAFFWAREVL